MVYQASLKQHDDLQALLDALPKEFMHLNQQQQKIAIALYRLLAKGETVNRQQLAEEAEVTTADINALFELTGGVYFNDDNNIIGFWGLTNQPMGHKFVVDGVDLSAWCA